MPVAGPGVDQHRLVALNEAGAGEDDALQQVALRANRTDPRQVGTKVSADVADGVAGGARGLLAVEDELALAHVTFRQRGQHLLEALALGAGVGVERRQQRLGGFADPGREFRQFRLHHVGPQRLGGLGGVQRRHQLHPRFVVRRLLVRPEQPANFQWPGGLHRAGQCRELLRRELGAAEHVGGADADRHRLLRRHLRRQEPEQLRRQGQRLLRHRRQRLDAHVRQQVAALRHAHQRPADRRRGFFRHGQPAQGRDGVGDQGGIIGSQRRRERVQPRLRRRAGVRPSHRAQDQAALLVSGVRVSEPLGEEFLDRLRL